MISPTIMLRRPSSVYRYFAPAVVLVMVVYWYILTPARIHIATGALTSTAAQLQHMHVANYHTPGRIGQIPVGLQHTKGKPHKGHKTQRPHPIEELVGKAQTTFNNLLARQTYSLNGTAAAYRERRGRHPPPGFDLWYKYAADNNVLIVEDFWDQIYDDLQPFWGVATQQLRHDTYNFHMKISVRNGSASTTSDWFWTQTWLEMIRKVEHMLPDMDIPLNAMDEPRMVVPWEDMREVLDRAGAASGTRDTRTKETNNVVTGYQQLDPDLSKDVAEPQDIVWETAGPYWDILRRGCDPESATRQVPSVTDFHEAPPIRHNYAQAHMQRGFVVNTTLASDICHQPDIQTLNGIFIEPLTISTTKKLFPLFGGSKLSVNNEILLPAPAYWRNDARFSIAADSRANSIAWEDKVNGSFWRGVATGGRNRPDNWRGFQRHRFVAMNNATALAAQGRSHNIDKSNELAAWVAASSDCAFVDLFCDTDSKVASACPYVDPHYAVAKGRPLSEQVVYKFLPDIDGNSFSGRYLAFLRSGSVPVKATVWREWHDQRLVAWKHYVPMDTRFSDWFGIMEFFVGRGGRHGRDDLAKRIAEDGGAWAERVLRKEDMQVYVLRLLLEYARVLDEKRERMGWVDDLQ
ncbi:glycosyltransferase family 90 protein [Ophiostoma piceae UAMH 11346]|uniref:Glycosyltransferase family 90 protein n=1 Tax=Ophiostoma piceae (strain UAMH 11346) TaxID=1262450 RepID=S3C8Q4_OPHP1|nr:glycosyltransferase family 90 protein [Ophiostoma piceae UAMH 11346]